tara:strand:+ start:312 stop:536 length:225 start_codon:yes stop_codon:yes gene_type:complete
MALTNEEFAQESMRTEFMDVVKGLIRDMNGLKMMTMKLQVQYEDLQKECDKLKEGKTYRTRTFNEDTGEVKNEV